ncbi:MAG TPA: amidase [Gemmatimonadales bacterium]
MDRREFGKRTAAGAAIALKSRESGIGNRESPPVPAFELEGKTLAELQEEMTAGRITSRRLVDLYTRRIADLDQRGPHLNHVLQVNPDARSIADDLDRERHAGRTRGPLHGIPVLIKDNIATLDQMETTAGSLALSGAKPPKDSTIARKLREAGAVILGKTNLSEWANFRSTRSTSGWSGRGGQTHNPYAYDRQPSGSSSGSGVAAASSSCAIAIGTETSGSIISPSNVNGIVGIKPTVGLWSRTGIIPISHSQDTPGPMARCVADAAALLTVLAGTDPADVATGDADTKKSDYVRALDADGLRGARIGVLRVSQNPDPKVTPLYDAAIAVLREKGAVIVDPVSFAQPQGGGGGGGARGPSLLEWEFKTDLERYLAEWAPTSPIKTLDDLVAFNNREAARELQYFGQETLISAARVGPLTSPEYIELRDRSQKAARADGIDATMDANHLDAVLGVSGGPARPIDLVNGDSGGGGLPGATGIAATAGYPHITVPMGYVNGLPVGLSFVGRAWSEATLIRLAFAFEQATRVRRAPSFAAGASL